MILTTYMSSGSYAYLIKRQAPVLTSWGYDVKVVLDVFNNGLPQTDDVVIFYSTFNNVIPFYYKFRKLKNVILFLDSALVTAPYVAVSKIVNNTNWVVVTPSQFNYNFASKVIKGIRLFRHFVPDLPKINNITIKPFNLRGIDFLTVGINEEDFDRKGHFWNFVASKLGFNTVRVCSNNFCFGGRRVNDGTLFTFYNSSKFYLGMSHAETPHLPTLEAFAFHTPAVLLNAHEFRYFPGIKVETTYVSVRGQRNFFFYEVNSEDFLNKILDLANITKEQWSALSNEAHDYFEKYIKMENRHSEFQEMISLIKR